MNGAIICSRLTKRYDGRPPVEAVRGVDLAVEIGECFGLLGPNGAGKTTTMEILEGLLDATSGNAVKDFQTVICVVSGVLGAWFLHCFHANSTNHAF